VPLSATAREVIASVGGTDFVFSLNGWQPLKGWSKYKERLDAAMRRALAEQGVEFRPWQHRDLRRTAKTLMKGAGVSRGLGTLSGACDRRR
jgi:hypothetical protein